jgi:DNA repair photolyase
VRWDTLDVGADEERRLPGYRDPAVVRTFDAPEALDTRFYEVRAKSALNRVPERSSMPFRWTINPYRGCTHACQFCLAGGTPILMADGRTRQIASLRPGDAIYGTVRDGACRRYTVTRVLDHWATYKKAYRVTLEDGTELVASGDHRFLTGRGWKHVAGAERGRWRRPHLTLNDKLMGTGAFVEPLQHSADYRSGYLCGMMRGDGHLGSYVYHRPGGSTQEAHGFRLALVDLEALQRAQDYLTCAGVPTQERLFPVARPGYREVRAVGTGARASVAWIRRLIEWPQAATDDWRKGFLAGIFDAEGSHGQCIRIANTDPAIVDWTCSCLRRLSFDHVIEDSARENGLRYVRIRGGLRERLRFFHTVDPAITRKRSIAGTAITGDTPLRVVSIERLGSPRALYDITTGTGDFIANGVVSHNCFARPTHTYLDFNAREDFEREIVVKVNAPEVVRAELSRPRWMREHVAMGTNTDPYQWVEGRYRLMPGIWEALRDSATPCSVLTKSPLVLRDVGLLQEVARRAPVAANLSVPTLEEKTWRATEPRSPNPRARLEAVRELNRAGIPTGILIAPLMPGINDDPRQVEAIVELAADAGAVSIHGLALHLRGEVRGIFLDWLRAKRPDLVPRYEELYARGAYAPRAERRRLAELVRGAGPAAGSRRDPAPPGQGERPFSRAVRWPRPSPPPVKRAGAAEPIQESLF